MEPEEFQRFVRSFVAAVAVGMVVGVGAIGLAWLLGFPDSKIHSPRALAVGTVFCGVMGGLGLKAAVERVAGVCGGLLLVPIGVGAAVAGTIGFVASTHLQFRTGVFALTMVAAVMFATAVIETTGERFR